ncbi:uncharacterized protein PgNI_09403 [Pyricularia grisea]|uniref:Uncharacterized protein n=1 Tax=Pyricularia grisea TaxID=148305 RepID=A0A6P8ARH9_PYRGI|nr:uncharacterized protein PgNI_09403 [Pyricularia grisea]TLD04702.1 hypothetical protein PgNI_09403 [Pyricularia grisea]
MSGSAQDVWTLKEKEVAMLTKLLILPPRHVLEYGWPSSKWLEKQEFKIENGFECDKGGWYRLTKRLERDMSTIQQMRVLLAEATGFQKNKVLPPRVDVCWVHRSLSPFVIHEVFECLAEEVTFKTDVVRGYRGIEQTADLSEFVNRMTGINGLWLSEDEFDEIFCKHPEGGGNGTEAFPEANRFLPLLNAIPRRARDKQGRRDRSKPRPRRSCEACVLAFVGARGRLLSDLRAHLLARSRVGGKMPRLLRFVDAWIQHFGGERAKRLTLESEDLADHIEDVLRRDAEEQRRNRRSKKARKSKGRSGQENSAITTDGEENGLPGPEPTNLGFPLPQLGPHRLIDNRVCGTSTARPWRNRESRNDFADDSFENHYPQGVVDCDDRQYVPAAPVASDPIVGGYAAQQEHYGIGNDYYQNNYYDNPYGYSHREYNGQNDHDPKFSDDDYDGQYTQLGENRRAGKPSSSRQSAVPTAGRRESDLGSVRQPGTASISQSEGQDDCELDETQQYIGPRSHWRLPNKKEEEEAAADEEMEHDETWDVQTRLREWSSRRQLRPEPVVPSEGNILSAFRTTSGGNSHKSTSASLNGAYQPSSNRTMTNLSAIVPPLTLRGTVTAAAAAAATEPDEDYGYESDSWRSASVMTWVQSSRQPAASTDVPPVPRIPSQYKERRYSRSQQKSMDRNSFYQLNSASSIYSDNDTASTASSVTVYTDINNKPTSTHLPVPFRDPFAQGQQSSGRARSMVSEVS